MSISEHEKVALEPGPRSGYILSGTRLLGHPTSHTGLVQNAKTLIVSLAKAVVPVAPDAAVRKVLLACAF